MNDRISQSFEKLKSNCIFAMSLGNKELFHSNFWAWLFKHDVVYLNVFFEHIKGDYEVLRENKHCDITIKHNGDVYIIENKLKSEYKEKQLKDYQANEPKFKGGCLAGIRKVGFNLDGWSFINYSEIAEKFKQAAESESDNKIKIIVQLYAESILELNNVLKCYDELTAGELSYWKEDISEKLKELRIWDLCQKIKTDEFVSHLNLFLVPYFEQKLNDIGSDYKIVIGSGYSNGNSIIDIKFESKIREHGDTSKTESIGVQIQGSQYRLFVNKPTDHNKKKSECADKIFSDFKKYNWFSEHRKGEPFNDMKTSMSNEFCKYQSDEYSFVYQYYNITEFGFFNLTEKIKGDMERAFNIIKGNL